MKNLALFLSSIGYKKILLFLRLDSKELDFIQAVFFKAFFRMDFSWRIISKYPLISLREWV
ncbi:hypothetical protein C2R87_04550 [Helicobacter pylori]|nr:hypothetical protein [Helicobacter pylori]PUD34079.1 hypothetical protein C2R87_04550 [Helicobacter pylori]